MPTTNPRVNVTLSPTLDGLVSDLAQLQRVSKATVLRELLEAAEPMLMQAVAMMRAAEELSAGAKTKVAGDLAKRLRKAEADAAQVMAQAAGVTQDLVAQAEAIRGRRPARSGDALAAPRTGRKPKRAKTPLPSNRGVKS